ncbi:MAG: hypothetical protein F6K47_23915 [Symploca sp. SIO2E6]|nr:hypothetical protein [Symploca sp. SIO2E6]
MVEYTKSALLFHAVLKRSRRQAPTQWGKLIVGFRFWFFPKIIGSIIKTRPPTYINTARVLGRLGGQGRQGGQGRWGEKT